MGTYYEQGAYRCEIIDQGLSQSSNGNPQIWLKIQVMESVDHPEEQLQSYDRTVFWTITDKTVNFVLDKLDALGFSGESWRQLDLNHANPQSFVGTSADFFCKLETYEGKERERWDLSFNTGGGAQALDEAQSRQLDTLFGKKLKERFRSTAKKPAKATKAANAELQEAVEGNDDVPF
jgi:hypothetical protein